MLVSAAVGLYLICLIIYDVILRTYIMKLTKYEKKNPFLISIFLPPFKYPNRGPLYFDFFFIIYIFLHMMEVNLVHLSFDVIT